MRLFRSDAGWQERENDIRADAVIVSMSPTKLSLGAVASLQSPLPFQPSKIIVPRIVIGGVILNQPAGGEIGAVGVGSAPQAAQRRSCEHHFPGPRTHSARIKVKG
jgi:hypothetical protein